jgi:prophage regulatory protein
VSETPTTSLTLIWESELAKQLGRSRYTLGRWVRQGTFPPPIKITQQGLAWRVRDIESWLDKLARSRKKVKRRGSLMEGDVLVEHSRRRDATDA